MCNYVFIGIKKLFKHTDIICTKKQIKLKDTKMTE